MSLGSVGHVELAKRSPPMPSGRFVNGVRSALALALRAAGDA